MKYSKEITESHPLAIKHRDAIILLNDLINKEGGKKGYFIEEIVLDIDTIEIKQKTGRGNRQETMDCCLGLCSSQMLLVEAKFRVIKPSNLGKSNLENKIKYTKSLLGQEIPIAKDKVFLFNDKIAEVARRHLARLFNNHPNLKVYSINEFKKVYFND